MTVPPRDSVQFHTPAYIGFVERISSDAVEGWAIDRMDLSRRLKVRAMADGEVLGVGVSNIYREHVHKSGAGDGRYGFRVAFNRLAIPLERISVVIDDSAHPFRLPLTQQAMAEMRARKASAYIGAVESITPGCIEGWAIDRNDLGQHLRVKANAAGRVLGSAICDLYREHLHKSGAGDGRYGFRILLEIDTPIDDIAVVVDDHLGIYRLPFVPRVAADLDRLEPPSSDNNTPDIEHEPKPVAAPSDEAMAALETRVQTLQTELARFKMALSQSIEKFTQNSKEIEALGPLKEELRDASPVPPEQLPWEARAIYRQLLQKLRAQV